jgi:hypothetical protein
MRLNMRSRATLRDRSFAVRMTLRCLEGMRRDDLSFDEKRFL